MASAWQIAASNGSIVRLQWTGLKHGTDQETDRKTDQLNLRFVALQVVGRAFTVVV